MRRLYFVVHPIFDRELRGVYSSRMQSDTWSNTESSGFCTRLSHILAVVCLCVYVRICVWTCFIRLRNARTHLIGSRRTVFFVGSVGSFFSSILSGMNMLPISLLYGKYLFMSYMRTCIRTRTHAYHVYYGITVTVSKAFLQPSKQKCLRKNHSRRNVSC